MAAPTQTDAKTALATRRENGNVATNTLADEIRRMQAQFQAAMPRGAEAAQLIRDALTALRTTPKLAQCEATSVLGALMTVAQLGLRPGVLGQAWILPFWDSRSSGYKAQFVAGYQGLIELAHRSGKISSLIARTAFSNDHFDVDYGLADSLIHKPDLTRERGEPTAYYAIAKFTTGGYAFIVMTQPEMLAYRQKYAKSRDRNGKIFGPWVDNFEEMAHKTCIRKLSKYMPKSTELAIAIAADGGVRVDLTPTVDASEVTEHPDMIDGDVVDADLDAAGPVEAAQGAEPQAGARKITEKQSKQIHALCGDLALDRDAKLAYASEILKKPIATTGDLTYREAAQFISALERYSAQNEPAVSDEDAQA